MNVRPSHLGPWLLLIVFSIQAIPLGIGKQFHLCIGCDQTGFTIETAPTAAPSPANDLCCDSKSETKDEPSEQLKAELDDCSCLRVSFDNVAPLLHAPPKSSTPRGKSPIPAALEMPFVTAVELVSAPPRAPPQYLRPTWLERSPLDQRTALLI